jgi:uncharacterized damage-inducible protein DinB
MARDEGSILAHGGESQQWHCGTIANLAPQNKWRHNPHMALEFTTSYVKDAVDVLRYYKRLGERAIEQVSDEALTASLDSESNCIALIVKHMSGNMRSRWRDFLTSDGEKPDRNRESEFEVPPAKRAEVLALWEAGWKYVFEALTPLTDADLSRAVTIRNEPHSVMQAINRQVAHYSYHVGQIVYLAKHLAGDRWTALTIPRGKSADFNARVSAGRTSQR